MRLNRTMWLALGLALASTSCGDDEANGTGTTTGTTTGTSPGGAGGETAGGEGPGGAGGSGAGGEGGEAGSAVTVVATFDAAAFELPEGLALAPGDEERPADAYVGFAFTGLVDTVSLADGARTPFANAPPPPPDTAFVTGLTFDPDGALYMAYVSFTDAQAPGIYRAASGGGAASLWSSHPQMVFPNGLAFDRGGDLFVTDSASGILFRIDAEGTAEPWATDRLLLPDATACGQNAAVAVGANGLAYDGESFIVASSDQALLLRIPVLAGGVAGPVETIAGPDCDALGGIDGIALDEDGSVLAAINRANKIVRVARGGGITTVAEGPPLDFPASVVLAGAGDDRAAYVTSFGLGAFLAGRTPQPALVRVEL